MSLDGVHGESMQYENKTHSYMAVEFQKFRGKEDILKSSMEKQIFYKGMRTKQLIKVLSQSFMLEDDVFRADVQWEK